MLVQNLLWRAIFHEEFQNFLAASVRIMNQGIELPVGESSGAPFPELDVAILIQFSGSPESLYRLPPFFYAGPSLQENRPVA